MQYVGGHRQSLLAIGADAVLHKFRVTDAGLVQVRVGVSG